MEKNSKYYRYKYVLYNKQIIIVKTFNTNINRKII